MSVPKRTRAQREALARLRGKHRKIVKPPAPKKMTRAEALIEIERLRALLTSLSDRLVRDAAKLADRILRLSQVQP